MKKIGVIISMFPEIHETFIVRELAELERQNFAFDIYSLQKPRDPVTLEEAQKLMKERTHYATLFGLMQWWAFFKCFILHPIRMLKLMTEIMWVGKDRPMESLKSLAILPITCFFSESMKSEGITHVHGHWANVPTTACWAMKRLFGFSWSAAIHGEDIFSPNLFLEHKLKEAAFTVVCTGYFCSHLKCNMNHTHPQDIHLNYHGLSPKIYERIAKLDNTTTQKKNTDAPFEILSIGRLVPTKGHDLLIQAVAILIKEGRSVRLSLIGSGPDEAKLKNLVTILENTENLALSQHIQFLGMRSFHEVMDAFERTDCFALACHMIAGEPPDGIPNVIAEAMALGVPIVSTRMGAIPELVEHEKTGLLAEPNDVPSLVNVLGTLISDSELRQTITIEARNKVLSMFDQKKNVSDLIALFKRYVGG